MQAFIDGLESCGYEAFQRDPYTPNTPTFQQPRKLTISAVHEVYYQTFFSVFCDYFKMTPRNLIDPHQYVGWGPLQTQITWTMNPDHYSCFEKLTEAELAELFKTLLSQLMINSQAAAIKTCEQLKRDFPACAAAHQAEMETLLATFQAPLTSEKLKELNIQLSHLYRKINPKFTPQPVIRQSLLLNAPVPARKGFR